ncbi:YqiA/YcfP family alpha/beta fold hydrolase [Empedobacter tilapiae]|uniref:YqiA/YcfP family alpha/beta fold hydrolase n=1 Tax=Empedobacter tilapiae TaxID=2491114 RepID=UPI0028D1DC81|nr:YqiA/YcfP family alpha/beta fold hydrolase [Empedobacter tilapiae]
MNTNNRQIVYIHGLKSSANSTKFKSILKIYPSAICVEWKAEHNIGTVLFDAYDHLKGLVNDLTIIGSSTGGNFGWQLQQKLKENGKSSELILLNPLVDVSMKVENNFPENLSQYLVDMNRFENTKVFLSVHDEVLDFEKLKSFFEIQQCIFPKQIEIIEIDDNHRILNFESLLTLI